MEKTLGTGRLQKEQGYLSGALSAGAVNHTGVCNAKIYKKLQFETVGIDESCHALQLLMVWFH